MQFYISSRSRFISPFAQLPSDGNFVLLSKIVRMNSLKQRFVPRMCAFFLITFLAPAVFVARGLISSRDVSIARHPSASLIELLVIEIAHLPCRERLAESRHPFLPFLVSDHGHALDLVEMLRVPLDVFPQSARLSAVKIAHHH